MNFVLFSLKKNDLFLKKDSFIKQFSMRMLLLLLMVSGLFFGSVLRAQSSDEDARFIRGIYDHALKEGQGYTWLYQMCTRIGGRLSGSPQAAAAVEFTRQIMDTLGLDSVWLQPCMVNHWVRGDKEQVRILNSGIVGTMELNALALGNSVGTGADGVLAEVIEVHSLDELEKLGKSRIEGKIVFFNRHMDPTLLNTMEAYGGAADQRVAGPSKAARYGAIAVIVRSLTTSIDDHPHTGVTVYEEGVKAIPAVAVSTKAADILSGLLDREPVKVYIRTTCQMLGKAPSFNVIGEIRGSEKPDEFIAIGGHLDSWDPGQGAHDDGAGCVQAIDLLWLIKKSAYRPRHTIRAVMFMNEENGLAGGKAYAEESNRKKEKHIAALESDSGGLTPRGFTFDAEKEVLPAYFEKVEKWADLLTPYGLDLKKGGSGADVGPLKGQNALMAGFRPDGQRYFDYHHTEIDTIDYVNRRELELGSAAMTSLVYLVDKYF